MEKGYSLYWDGIKNELKEFYPQTDYHMFISKIEYHNYDPQNKIMTLSVPSNFIKDHVSKYKLDIENILSKISGDKCGIEFIISNITKNKESVKTTEKKPQANESVSKDKKNLNNTSKIEDYSFESFIIGSSNEFAAKAAQVVASNLGTHYNPYFVWGDSGLGKTHLLKAIEIYVKDHYPSKKVKYVTSEEFTNDFVNSLRSKTQEQFRIKYRKLDVLIIDDVQFFANKEGIQAELFNTFNKLYDDFKQLVFSCDQHISKVKSMEERLKSRFGMGLTVDLRPPDFELRMAIMKNLSETYNLDFDNTAMEYICSNLSGNIRDLKSAFQVLLAYSSIMNVPITLDIAKENLKEKLTGPLSSPISVDKIIQVVAEYYNLKSHEIIGIKRTKSIAFARQIAMYISRKITRLSTTQIGKYFGDKEHGTVMHATKKVEDLMNKEQRIKKDIDTLINSLNSE